MILNSPTVKKIANNTFYQLVGKIVSMTITVLATVLVARYYGRESYGEFSLMQNVPALFFIIVDFGFNAISTRELSKDFSNAHKYFVNILVLRVFSSLALMLIVALSLRFFPYSDDLKLGLYLSLFLILTQALYSTTNVIFQVKLRYDLSTIGYVIGSLVVLLLVTILTTSRAPVMWVNFSYVIGGFVTFFVNLYLLSYLIDLREKVHIDRKLLKYLSLQSLPLGLMFIFSQINFKADSILLSLLPIPDNLNLKHTEVVAVYNLPFKIFEVALVIPTFVMNAIYPIFIRHFNTNKSQFLDTFKLTTLSLFTLGLVGAFVGVLLSDFIILILGGAEFTQSATVLKLLLLGLPIFYISQPLSWLIVTLDKQKVLPLIYLISALFNLVLNILLIPIYSYNASALLTWLSELVILVLLSIFAYSYWKKAI